MRSVLASLCLITLMACGSDQTAPATPTTPASLAVQAGAGQTAASGAAVAIAPAVQVRDGAGRGVAGVTVVFAVAEGGGALEGATPVTDAAGVATVSRWVLGESGPQRLSARVGTLAPISITATLTPGTEVLRQSAPAAGGTVAITTPGHPYRGLQLQIPAGTFPVQSDWTFRVVPNAPLPTLPTGYRVAGAPLEIESAQARGALPMLFTVPVRRTAGSDVVLVLQDPTRNALEVLPTVARTDSSVTVLTTHLRGDLLLGRAPATSSTARAATTTIAFPRAVPIGRVLPIEFSLPMPTVPILPRFESLRWPVQDYGSDRVPTGFGPEIAALRVRSAALGTIDLRAVVDTLRTPGLYADAGVLAVLERATSERARLFAFLDTLSTALGRLSKATRDELVVRHLVSQMAITGLPAMAMLASEGATVPSDEAATVSVVGGLETGLTLSNAAANATFSITRPSSGFTSVSVRRYADDPGTTVNRVLPISSFLADFERVGQGLTDLLALSTLTGSARETRNRALAALASLRTISTEYQVGPSGGWIPFDPAVTVIRSPSIAVRIPSIGGLPGTGLVMHIPSSGAEAGRASGNVLLSEQLGAIRSLARGVTAPFLFTAGRLTPAGALRPMNAIMQQVQYALYSVSPERAPLTGATRRAEFTADIASPPSAGYRIRWDWGDGNVTESLSLPTASHDYAAPGEYRVIATLLTVDTRAVMAVDTVVAGALATPEWIITSIADPDRLIADLAPEEINNPLARTLKRLLDAPRSGAIVVEPEGTPVRSILRLKVQPGALWDVATCCRAPVPTEYQWTLGSDPAFLYSVGPFFSAFNRDVWSQSTTNLNAGTMTSQGVTSFLRYNVRDGGMQDGPGIAFRMNATRSGAQLSGTITVYLWYVDDVTDLVDSPTAFAFPFTATRAR